MDNTWATFIGLNPLEWGVDVAIESCTKYFSGHSDNFQAAFDKAKHSIDSGLANQTLNLVREYSQKLND